MKKILAVLMAALMLFALIGCEAEKEEGFPISEEEAIEIAEDFLKIEGGTKDDKTGFLFSYFVFETPTEENPRYKIALRWLVMDSHYSTVDEVYVDANTGECSYPN